jgi:hypothetical protein
MSEEEAKQAWLARTAPEWGSPAKMSEAAAKRAWLAKLDVPSWGRAAAQVTAAAQEFPAFAPAAAAVAAIASQSLSTDSIVQHTAEEIAKQAWLARIEEPNWAKRVDPAAPAAPAPQDMSSLYGGSVVPSHFIPTQKATENAAKLAWLAENAPAWQRSTVAALGVGGQELMMGAPTQSQTYGREVGGRAPPMADSPILVQGGSLRTWSYKSPAVEQVQVILSTEGRPLDADIELWHGPDNTPVKMRVYVENGQIRPFSAVIETPRGPNTVAIRNIGQIEFPIAANVIAEAVDMPSPDALDASMTIQGGALRTYPFDPTVDSVEVLIKTDGRPLNARIELLQGPNNNKEVIELYTEDGCDRPFFCILETPGSGNVVRIVNTSPVEFPMSASVVPHSVNQDLASNVVLGGDVVIGGDAGW